MVRNIWFSVLLMYSSKNYSNKILILVEDVDNMKNKSQNEVLPLTSPNYSPVVNEPIQFSEIRSRSSNQ